MLNNYSMNLYKMENNSLILCIGNQQRYDLHKCAQLYKQHVQFEMKILKSLFLNHDFSIQQVLIISFIPFVEILPAEDNVTPKEHKYSETLDSAKPPSPSQRNSSEYRNSGNKLVFRNSVVPSCSTSNSTSTLRRVASNSAANNGYYDVNRARMQRRIEGK